MVWLPRYRLIEHTVRICQCLTFLSTLWVVNRFSRKRLEKILFLSYEISANDWILEVQLICFPRNGCIRWRQIQHDVLSNRLKLPSRRNVFESSGVALLQTWTVSYKVSSVPKQLLAYCFKQDIRFWTRSDHVNQINAEDVICYY